MQHTTVNWSRTPLFHTEKNVISMSTKGRPDLNCWLNSPRLNVGNLEAIKQYWQAIEAAECAR